MSNDINYIFKRVIIGLIIFFVISFVKSCEVSASALEIDLNNFSINGTNNTFYSYAQAGQNLNFRAYTYSYYGAYSQLEENVNTKEKYSHLVINTCSLNNNGTSYVYGVSNIRGNVITKGANVYKSRTRCSFILDGVQYNGYYLYFYFPVRSNYVNLESVVWDNVFNVTIHFTQSQGILALGATAYTEFPLMLAQADQDMYIINQNETIINQNSQMITNQNTTNAKLNENIDATKDINNSINNDDVSGANAQVDSLLQNNAFNDSTGIQSIINAPLNFINSLSNSCNPIQLTIPYIDTNVSIPCIKQELSNRVPTIVPILSTAINGFIIYRILIDIVYIIKSAKNPDDDRIEVLDL